MLPAAFRFGLCVQNLNQLRETIKAYKDELDRLSRRAQVAKNRMESMKSVLLWAMNTMHVDKIKTALFTASVRENPVSINADDIHINEIPEKYIKKEVSKSAVSADLKDGKLQTTETGLILGLDGSILGGLKAVKSKSLQIR